MKLKIALVRVLLGGVLLGTSPVWAADERPVVSLDWLTVIAYAAQQTEYTGIFVYQYGNDVESSRITHVVGSDGQYEKVESLDGPVRQIIRHHGQTWTYVNDQLVQVDSQQGHPKFPTLLTEQLPVLSENYTMLDAGSERIAGYPARVLLFQPRDVMRYAQKIWIHSDSGLLLKAAVLNENGQVLEQYAFSQLQIGGKIDRSWVKPLNNQTLGSQHGKRYLAAKNNRNVNSGWSIEAIPVGFKKILEIERPMRGKAFDVTQIVFSDGLSAISIFVEPSNGAVITADPSSNRGAVSLSKKILDKHLITVVGEVPLPVIRQVANSVRFSGKP